MIITSFSFLVFGKFYLLHTMSSPSRAFSRFILRCVRRLRHVDKEAARLDAVQAEAMLLSSLRTEGGVDATFASPPRSDVTVDPFETFEPTSPIGRTTSLPPSQQHALTASTGFRPTTAEEVVADEDDEDGEGALLPPSRDSFSVASPLSLSASQPKEEAEMKEGGPAKEGTEGDGFRPPSSSEDEEATMTSRCAGQSEEKTRRKQTNRREKKNEKKKENVEQYHILFLRFATVVAYFVDYSFLS